MLNPEVLLANGSVVKLLQVTLVVIVIECALIVTLSSASGIPSASVPEFNNHDPDEFQFHLLFVKVACESDNWENE